MWFGSVYIFMILALIFSSLSPKYIPLFKLLLIFPCPSIPTRRAWFLGGSTISGSTRTSLLYVLLKSRTISRVCSSIGFWSSPTGTSVALNAVISAAWLTGYVKNPAGILSPNFLSLISCLTVGLRCNLETDTRFM